MSEIYLDILGDCVKVTAPDNFELNYLKKFYPLSKRKNPEWCFFCEIKDQMNLSETFEQVIDEREIKVIGTDTLEFKAFFRKRIRDTFIYKLYFRKFSLFHSAALYKDNRIFLFIGDCGAGKTTLSLDGIFNHQYKLISNDHLVVCMEDDQLIFSTIPTYIRIKIGTYLNFRSKLPFSDSYDDFVREYSSLDKDILYGLDVPVYFTHSEIGENVLPVVKIDLNANNEIYVIRPKFTKDKPTIKFFEDENYLSDNIRFKWLEDNWPVLLSQEKNQMPQKLLSDSNQIISKFNDKSKLIEFAHNGTIQPVIKFLESPS